MLVILKIIFILFLHAYLGAILQILSATIALAKKAQLAKKEKYLCFGNNIAPKTGIDCHEAIRKLDYLGAASALS